MIKIKNGMIGAIVLIALALNISYAQNNSYQGERLSFDEGWKFKLGNALSADENMHLHGKGFYSLFLVKQS